LSSAKADLGEGIQWMGANAMANFDNAGAGSMDLLNLFALTAIAEGWARMARVAVDRQQTADPYYARKLITGRYFLARILPDAKAHLAKLKTGAEPVMALPAEAF
ncbi:MAG: acyl-CoA dehydrogenase C-terminal domain-containing protein, partial [Parvularculaceae bacterium]